MNWNVNTNFKQHQNQIYNGFSLYYSEKTITTGKKWKIVIFPIIFRPLVRVFTADKLNCKYNAGIALKVHTFSHSYASSALIIL
jgi:hypothetical protein